MSLKFLINKFDGTIKHSYVSTIDFSISGLFIVDVPDGVNLATPTDYADLKTKKSASFLTLYPDFTNVEYNELDNDTAVNTAATGHRAHTGHYEWMLPAKDTDNGQITTNVAVIVGSPVQVVPFWSVYELQWSAGYANDLQATYIEHDTTDLVVDISLDNGATWDVVTDQLAYNPTVTGTNMIWRFKNQGVTDLYLGYYVMIWR